MSVGVLPDGVRLVRLSAEDPAAGQLLRGGLRVKNADWIEPAYLDAMDARFERTADAWERALHDGRLTPTWVAVAGDGEVVGIAGGGSVEVPSGVAVRLGGGTEGTGAAVELSMLYVDAAWRGSGVAAALACEVIGDEAACLWVLEENPRARAFYAKLGFEPDGAVEELPPPWRGAREVRLSRPAR